LVNRAAKKMAGQGGPSAASPTARVNHDGVDRAADRVEQGTAELERSVTELEKARLRALMYRIPAWTPKLVQTLLAPAT